MEKFIEVLNSNYNILHEGEEIIIEDHVLNLTPEVNKSFDKNKLIHDLHEAEEDILKVKEHLKDNPDVKLTKSAKGLIRLCLEPYENRTIEIEKDIIDYERIVSILKNHKITSTLAGYKYCLFKPFSENMWKKHSPKFGERMVFYAFPRKRAVAALEEIAQVLGKPVANERKKYSNYTSRTYKINDHHGLHARPAAMLVKIASKYHNADVWARTDSNEVNAKSIMHLFLLKAINKPLTLLINPIGESKPIYEEIESIPFRDKTLFSRIN